MSPLPKAIVLVDDEKSYVDFLSTMLTENLGCPVFSFIRPLDALAALPEINVGVVVTDYCMPQLNGFELVRRASRVTPGVPFILISGHPIHLEDAEPDVAALLRVFLAKPFSWRILADEIVRYAPEFAFTPARAEADPSF